MKAIAPMNIRRNISTTTSSAGSCHRPHRYELGQCKSILRWLFILLLIFACSSVLLSLALYANLESPGDIYMLSLEKSSKKAKKQRLRQDDPTEALQYFAHYFFSQQAYRERTGQKTLKQEFLYEPNTTQVIQRLKQTTNATVTGPYDIYNCSKQPPPNYPYTWNVLDVLDNWNPDDTTLPTTRIYQGLCIFDWRKSEHQQKAQRYRELEVPFVVQNHPEIMKTAERWSRPGYLQALIGESPQRNEHSNNNHLMFWRTNHKMDNTPQGWKPPIDNNVQLTYSEWLKKAKQLELAKHQSNQEHWYFRLNAMYTHENTEYSLYDELPFFNPAYGPQFTMVEPEQHRGINCRFGMRGNIAEAHFDSSRNFIAVLGGARRYILAHPNQCLHMELHPGDHPSGRHSKVNWSEPVATLRAHHSTFAQAQVNEVVLQASDMLYLPTFWFHFIVSLNTNYQCNARCGTTLEYEQDLVPCHMDEDSLRQSLRRKNRQQKSTSSSTWW